jgi:hypothetical protein
MDVHDVTVDDSYPVNGTLAVALKRARAPSIVMQTAG